MPETCVIVGASHAGAQVAMRLHQLGWQVDIRLIGDEAHLLYHRPPLSKDYLKGAKTETGMLLHPAIAYKKVGVLMALGSRVETIDHKKNRCRWRLGKRCRMTS